MSFNIGDRVRVKTWDEIDEKFKSKCSNGDPRIWTIGKSKTCGMVGTIVDKLYSEAFDIHIYTVHFDGMEQHSRSQFDENSIVKMDSVEYKVDIRQDNDRVYADLIKCEGDKETVIRSGFGKILEDSAYGYAQAASYAMLKIYKSF